MSKLCKIGLLMLILIMIIIFCHSKLHMPEICGEMMPDTCAIYSAKLCIFFRIFCLKNFRIF